MNFAKWGRNMKKLTKEQAQIALNYVENIGDIGCNDCNNYLIDENDCPDRIEECYDMQLQKLQEIIDAPKYRPFKNADEFRPYRNKAIKYKDGIKKENFVFWLAWYNDDGFAFIDGNLNNRFKYYKQLLAECVFEDGTPCGIME